MFTKRTARPQATYCSELQSIGGHHGLLPMPAQQAPIMVRGVRPGVAWCRGVA